MCATHHHARRAEPALQGIVFDERLLHRMKLLALRESLDRRNLLVTCIERERHAARDDLAVEPDRACRAGAAIAADLGAGEAELVAQDLDESGCGIDVQSASPAVDRERQFHHRRFP
jgi:hypothetical protein